MIIQKQKPIEEILDALKGQQKIFISGCSDCATACKVGGEEEIAAMKARLEQAGKTVTGACIFDTACLRGAVRDGVKAHQAEFDAADRVLCLHCGTGVQTIGDNSRKPVHP
ncbi:MAG TPA: 5,10-methylenetetrahydrofolate reductase, partial [Candidatus Brocadiia bacterium]|nr:5,10-methylenetetrahydrofolate reductase [Candidatus Brocadiia bacterium]